jgi:hypothetical protein
MQRAIERGVAYVTARQHGDGHWEEFALPVGRSGAWVTAYTGVMLLEAARSIGSLPRAAEAAGGAGRWLRRNRPYAAGWGFNEKTGPDADSTAYALLLLRELGEPVARRDEEWLRARWRANGGFATYERPDQWGMAHPDVTPMAYRALAAEEQARLRTAIVACLHSSRETDGTWPAYWWRTRHYSTFLNAALLRELEAGAQTAVVISEEESRTVRSAFDLAYLLGTAWLSWGAGAGTSRLAEELVALQRDDGSWPGTPILRVSRHDARDPWRHPEGALYADTDHLFTTASAVRMLAMTSAEKPQ